jgi:hypothetical protein
MGNLHQCGDRRIPLPGVLGGMPNHRKCHTVTAACAVVILLAWIRLYTPTTASYPGRYKPGPGQRSCAAFQLGPHP